MAKTIATFVYQTSIPTKDERGPFVAVHSKMITGVLVKKTAGCIWIKPAVLNERGSVVSINRSIAQFSISKISGPINFKQSS